MFWYAEEFARAAVKLRESPRHETSMVVYYLLAHSIELGLKSFLRTRGIAVQVLRQKYRHDLWKSYRKAEAEGLGLKARLVNDQEAALRVMNSYYRDKDLEYFSRGMRHLPYPETVVQVAIKVLEASYPHCVKDMQTRKNH